MTNNNDSTPNPGREFADRHPISQSSPPTSKPGRPRNEAAHQAVLDFTKSLAKNCERFRDISIEAIANGAKVGKSTIYRWWDTKAEIIYEACLEGQLKDPQKPSLIEDIEDFIQQEVALTSDSMSRIAFAGFCAEFIQMDAIAIRNGSKMQCPYTVEKLALLGIIFERARERGDWSGPADIESAHEALTGAPHYRIIVSGLAYEEERIPRLARHALSEAHIKK